MYYHYSENAIKALYVYVASLSMQAFMCASSVAEHVQVVISAWLMDRGPPYTRPTLCTTYTQGWGSLSLAPIN